MPSALLERALELLDGNDAFAAIEFLCAQTDPRAAMDAFAQLVMDLYWKRKDLPRAIALGRAGVQFALAQGDASLRPAGKAIAYNIASFAWPGWDEPGIMISPTDAALAMDAAR